MDVPGTLWNRLSTSFATVIFFWKMKYPARLFLSLYTAVSLCAVSLISWSSLYTPLLELYRLLEAAGDGGTLMRFLTSSDLTRSGESDG